MWDWIFKNERWLTPLFWAVGVLGTGLVNTSSLITESERAGSPGVVLPHAINEFTSSGVILLLVPAVYWMVSRAFRHAREWWQIISLFMVGALVFSLIHITLMVALRHVFFALAGGAYSWGPIVEAGIYEFRKDIISYATILGLILLFRSLRDAQMALLKSGQNRDDDRGRQRLSFRNGASTIWIAPNEVLYAQAAGNYVELHLTDGSTKLLRQTLSYLESELDAAQFVRTHRSYVLRRNAVESLEPTGSGDHRATLKGGAVVPVSRRYKDALRSDDQSA